MAILILADHDQGRLSQSVARLVTAAKQVGGDIHVLVATASPDAIAAEAATIEGVAKVLSVAGVPFERLAAEPTAALLQTLAGGYTHILCAASGIGRDVMPRLAALLDVMPVTDVVKIHGPQKFDRPVYAGNAIETVSSAQTLNLITVRGSQFARAGTSAGVPVELLGTVPEVPAGSGFLQELRTTSDVPDLSAARIVVSGGVSFGSAENFKLVEQLAATLGAAVGATRAAVDAGYAPNDWQVGQTGKIVAPDLYIGIGISGALQHLAGIQGAKKIIAINADPEAPLMKIADYALVGDLFELVPELTKLLREKLG